MSIEQTGRVISVNSSPDAGTVVIQTNLAPNPISLLIWGTQTFEHGKHETVPLDSIRLILFTLLGVACSSNLQVKVTLNDFLTDPFVRSVSVADNSGQAILIASDGTTP